MHSQLHVSMEYEQSKLIIRIFRVQLNRWGKYSYRQITTTIWHLLQQNHVKIIVAISKCDNVHTDKKSGVASQNNVPSSLIDL